MSVLPSTFAAAHVDAEERLAVDARGREGGDAAARRCRADVAHAQAGDDALIEPDRGGRRDRRPFERGRARLGPGDDLARDGALRVLEHAVIDRSVGLGLLDGEVRRPRPALSALVDGRGNPHARDLAVRAQVRLGDLFAAAYAALVDDADLEEGVRIEEDVLHVAVLERDAELVRGRAVDVFDAQ